MEELLLPVNYKGETREFKTVVVRRGYTYQLLVTVDGTELAFEKDEEGQFRALSTEHTAALPDPGLIAAIATQLNEL